MPHAREACLWVPVADYDALEVVAEIAGQVSWVLRWIVSHNLATVAVPIALGQALSELATIATHVDCCVASLADNYLVPKRLWAPWERVGVGFVIAIAPAYIANYRLVLVVRILIEGILVPVLLGGLNEIDLVLDELDFRLKNRLKCWVALRLLLNLAWILRLLLGFRPWIIIIYWLSPIPLGPVVDAEIILRDRLLGHRSPRGRLLGHRSPLILLDEL